MRSASFAAILIAICGLDWLHQPTVVPALAVGVFTVALPFFLMQPGMGLGVAASKTPRPNVARVRSNTNHTIFVVGDSWIVCRRHGVRAAVPATALRAP